MLCQHLNLSDTDKVPHTHTKDFIKVKCSKCERNHTSMHMYVQYVYMYILCIYLFLYVHFCKQHLYLMCTHRARVYGKKVNEFIMQWNNSCTTNQSPFTTDRVITLCASHNARDKHLPPPAHACTCTQSLSISTPKSMYLSFAKRTFGVKLESIYLHKNANYSVRHREKW